MGKRKKSRAFSIYLLKTGVTIVDALKEGHDLHLLEEGDHASSCDGRQMEIYLSGARSTPPWWRSIAHVLAPRNSSTSLLEEKYFYIRGLQVAFGRPA